MKTLRPYQQAAIDAINENLPKTNKQVIVLPTGSGKTIVFCHLISQRKNLGKTLILAHREELLTQAKEKLLDIDSTLDVQIEMAEQEAEPQADVIIASVPTIGRKNSERIKKFDPNHFRTIIIDEAHHSSASTYKNVLEYFGVLKNVNDWRSVATTEPILLIGVTATPSRADNKGIDEIFDEVVYKYEIIDAIREGYLARIRAYRVDTTTSLENVHTRAGDFAQDELADAINNKERNDLVVKTYQEQFDGKQALVFAIDIEHAIALYKAFAEQSIFCGFVSGTTDKQERKELLEAFHTKKIQVIVNVGVLTEGVDIPTIDVVIMARPTKSGVLFNQMAGRCMRPHPDKPYASIIDIVDNTYKHTIKTSASLLGIESKIQFRGRDILEAYSEIEKIRELAPGYNLDYLDFDKLQYIMEEVDLMSGLGIPKDIEAVTKYAWYRHGEEGYRINIGDQRYFVIQKDMVGKWVATFEYWDIDLRKTISEELGEEESKDLLIQRVDKYIRSNYEESLKLIYMSAHWRKDPISPAQVTQLQKFGVSPDIISQMNKGMASQLQSKLYSQRKRYR